MEDSKKTKAQLIEELQALRKQSESYEDFLSKPLYQSAELMRLITENTTVNIGILTFDLKAEYVYANPSVKTTLGYTPEELVGRSFFDFIHPDDKKALLPLLKSYLQKKVKNLFTANESEISEVLDFRFIDKSGHWRYLRSTVNIAGKYLLAVSTDISAQKEIDLRLQEAAAKWETTFNAMSDSVSIIDTDGHLIQYNDATLTMFDISKLEIQSKYCWELVHKTSEPVENCPVARMKQSRQPETMVIQDGERWLEISVYPVFDSAKNIIGAVHVVSNITERKKAEKALQKRESKYRTLFEQSADALLIIKEGKFIDCNPATVRMLGYKNKEDLLNTHPAELSPETQPDGRESFGKANEMISIALKNGSHRFEWQHKKRNGTVFPVEVLLTSISIEKDEFIHVVWRDISQRKEAEEAVKKNEARLRRAELASKSGNWELDLESGKITGSDGASAIYGLTGKEFNYEAIKKMPLAEYRPLLDAALNDLIQKQKPYQIEFKIKTADSGQEKYIYSSAQYDEQNKIVFGILQDITEYKQIQNALKESEQKNRLLIDMAPDSFFQGDSNGDLIRVNAKACELTGYSEKELLTFNLAVLFDSESLREKPLRYDLLKKGQVLTTERKMRKKNGACIYVEMNSRLMPDKTYQSFIRDISERKQAEEKLQENENRMRLIVEGTPNLFFYTQNKKGELTYISPSVEKITGRTVDEWKKRKNWFLTDNPMNAPVKETTRKHLNGEPTEGPIRAEIAHAENYPIFLEIYENIIFKDGKVAGLHGVAHDITQKYRAEENFKQSGKNFRLLFENSPMGIYFATPQGEILDGNEALLNILGSPSLEATRQINVLQFPPLIENGYAALFKQCVEENKTSSFELSYTSKWGKSILLSSYIIPLANADGTVEKVYTIMEDITERKLAEERVRESEERFRMAFYTSPDAITISRVSDGKYLDVNDGFVSITGFSKEYAIGKTAIELKIWRDEKERAQLVEALKTHGVVHNMEVRLRTKNGGEIYGLLSATLMQLNHEMVILSISRDITDRKLAEKQLFESEERYRSLVEQMTDGVYRSTEDGRFLDVNPAMVRILGYENKEELMKIDIKKELYFKNTERNEVVESLKLSGNRKIDTFRLRHKKGHEIWVEDHGRLVFDENGKILYHEGVLRDITERREAQEHIARLAEFNKNIVSSAPVGIVTVNNKKQVTSANDTFMRMMGSPGLEEVIKIGIDLPIFSNENIRDFFRNALIKGHSFEIKHLPYTSYWGKELVIDLKGVPQKTEEGVIYGVIIVVNDVTKNVEAEEERKKLEIQLRRAQKLETIGTLAGGIAHDFNNILAPIMGFTELALLKVDESAPMARDLNQVLKGAHRAKELVEQILLFSKRSEKEHRSVALQPLINEALKLLRPSIPSTVEIRKEIDPSCSKIRADATQIHQIIVNLCTNAWHAMAEGGTLTIRLEQTIVDSNMSKMHPNLAEGAYVRLSVIDTGSGMDEKTLDRIFEPFFTTKAVNKGTGLGLSVVHGIVRNHGGDILVYSEPGKGSAFHIYFPALLVDTDEESQKTKTVPGGDESVLIVDDEPVIAEMVKTMLENFGYRAHIYKTGMDAVEAFERQPQNYDLLITDLTMPQMTGLDLADKLHETTTALPVIIMTGFGDSLTKPTLKRYGIKQVISKPVVVKELARAVRHVLDN